LNKYNSAVNEDAIVEGSLTITTSSSRPTDGATTCLVWTSLDTFRKCDYI